MKSEYLISVLIFISSTLCQEPGEELLPDNFEEPMDDVEEEPVTMMEEEDVTMTTPITTPIMRTTTISVVSDKKDVKSSEPASPRENSFGDSGLEVNDIEVTTETETTTQEITTEKIEATSLKENINDQKEVTITDAHKPRYISNGWFLFPDGSINQGGNPLYQTVQRFPAVNKPVLPSKTSYFSYPWHHFPQKWASEPYSNEVNSNNHFQFNNNFPFKYPYVYYSLNIKNQDSV